MKSMDEAIARAAVVRIAEEWIGTPFVWGSHVKGAGADCTFVYDVYKEAGVIPNDTELPVYCRNAHMNGQNHYESVLDRVGAKRTDNPQQGDLCLFEAMTRSHSGIITEWPSFIHAHMRIKRGQICRGNDKMIPHKSVRFYTFW